MLSSSKPEEAGLSVEVRGTDRLVSHTWCRVLYVGSIFLLAFVSDLNVGPNLLKTTERRASGFYRLEVHSHFRGWSVSPRYVVTTGMPSPSSKAARPYTVDLFRGAGT